jgi:hypothetical protein
MLAIWPIATLPTFGEKIMKNSIRFAFVLALLCAAMSTASFGSSMYIVQGIAGRDYVTPSDPAFPVDVLLNGEICYVRGLAFGTVEGPLTFDPGSVNIKISVANSLAPCTNTPLIDQDVTIDPKSDMSAVATLDASGNPVLLTFTNSLSPVSENTGRILLAQAANSPAVQVILENSATQKLYTYVVKPGALLDVNLPAGQYSVEINQGTTTLVPATYFNLYSQSVELLYTLGQASNDTVVLETRAIRSVI